MKQTNEDSGGAGLSVRTWRERMGVSTDFPLSMPSSVERAMEEEIAALRANTASRRYAGGAPSEVIADRQYLDGFDAGFMAGEAGDHAKRAGVHEARRAGIREALSTSPAPAAPPLVGKLLDEFSELPILWGLNEPGALVRHGDVFKMLVTAGKTYLSAQPAEAAGEAVQNVLTIPAAIMNIPCKPGRGIAVNGASKQAYQEGHRDARHAAADLVLERADELKALATQGGAA